MKKIDLLTAYNILNKNKGLNAFSSHTLDRYLEDEKKLLDKKELFLAVKATERASGIDLIRDQIEALQFEIDFYDTGRKPMNYKDALPKKDLKRIKEIFKTAKDDREYLNERVKLIIKNVYVEV